MGMWNRLLLPPLPRVAVDGRAAVRPALCCVRPGVLVDRSSAVAVPADDQQPVAQGMSTAHSEDAGAKSEDAVAHRGHHRAPMGTRHRGLLPVGEANACTRVRAGHGSDADLCARIIAHGGDR